MLQLTVSSVFLSCLRPVIWKEKRRNSAVPGLHVKGNIFPSLSIMSPLYSLVILLKIHLIFHLLLLGSLRIICASQPSSSPYPRYKLFFLHIHSQVHFPSHTWRYRFSPHLKATIFCKLKWPKVKKAKYGRIHLANRCTK